MVENQEQEEILLYSSEPLELCTTYTPDLCLTISLGKNEEDMQIKVSL